MTGDAEMDFIAAVDKSVLTMGLLPLKPKQLEAVKTFVAGNDTFVTLPTGYGKSVIFAILPLVFDNMLGTLVKIVFTHISHLYVFRFTR